MPTNRRKFIKITGLGTLAISTAPLFLQSCKSDEKKDLVNKIMDPNVFERVTPESQGITSSSIQKFIEEANKCDYEWHSYIYMRHGKVVSEGYWSPFEKGDLHTLYSLSKAFTSTAVGLLVDEGKLNVDDKLISFFPESLPDEVSDNLKAMTVKHMLTMNTGHDTGTMGALRSNPDKTWIESFLAHPVVHEPGSHFLYNTGSTYMLGAIVHKITGLTLTEFLKPRLFDPLDIKDYDWETSPQGLNTGGYGLRLSSDDISKFGQLYLQEGMWNGKQILSKEWVSEASKRQGPSQDNDGDWGQGYGYQFWRCKPGFYRGDGAFGQYCIVMPEQDAVLIINSESWDMGKSMQIAWDNLLPGIKDEALPENPDALKSLNDLISTLVTPTIPNKEAISSSFASTKRTIKIDANDFGITSINLAFENDKCVVDYIGSDNASVTYGWGSWILNESKNYPLLPEGSNQSGIAPAGSAAWLDENSLLLVNKFVQGIHSDKLAFKFDGNKVKIELLGSVQENRDNETRMPLTGMIV